MIVKASDGGRQRKAVNGQGLELYSNEKCAVKGR